MLRVSPFIVVVSQVSQYIGDLLLSPVHKGKEVNKASEANKAKEVSESSEANEANESSEAKRLK